MKQKSTLYKMVLAAIFCAIIIVVQTICAVAARLGIFSFTLALVPIVVGGMLLGPGYGTIFGGVFGLISYIFCLTGLDAGGAILVGLNPLLTALICFLKGFATGLVPSLVYRVLHKKNFHLAAILGALLAPFTNTGFFLVFGFWFFKDTLVAWGGGGTNLFRIIITIIGVNFLIEFFSTLLLSPAILRILQISKKNRLLD